MPNLIYNALMTPDGTVLESRSVHDCRTHVDTMTGKTYMVDGGLNYLRRSCNGDEKDMSLYDNQPHRKQRDLLTWGTYGKDGNQPYRRITIADMETGHIEAVLKECQPLQVLRNCMEQELLNRETGYNDDGQNFSGN